ncbi:MAG: hypothetical protein AVDCRST_MAG50-782, partial [uncultured Acidimicrobiales bacterium]
WSDGTGATAAATSRGSTSRPPGGRVPSTTSPWVGSWWWRTRSCWPRPSSRCRAAGARTAGRSRSWLHRPA